MDQNQPGTFAFQSPLFNNVGQDIWDRVQAVGEWAVGAFDDMMNGFFASMGKGPDLLTPAAQALVAPFKNLSFKSESLSVQGGPTVSNDGHQRVREISQERSLSPEISPVAREQLAAIDLSGCGCSLAELDTGLSAQQLSDCCQAISQQRAELAQHSQGFGMSLTK